MELYILSKQDLSILSIAKVADYQINLDEETNAKSTFTLIKTNGLQKDNFIVLNGLYRQFLFIIDDVETEKGSNVSTVTALDISNIFDRKVIEKNTSTMTSNSIEQFIADTISENFVNSTDPFLNIGYIDIYWHTNTQASVATNAENGLYNFHTFLTNCRQYKNIYTDFKFENERLKIDIENKTETTELIDTTLPEVTDYNKIYEDDITAKVTVLIREDNSEYNLYLKTDRTTTTNANDPNRAKGKIEVISVDTADMAPGEALNVMKGNNYKHLVEFKIAKTSKLMDITKLHIGRPVIIRTDDDTYESYISAITLTDENFVYFKSGSLRTTLIDKLKANTQNIGNKVDVSGGKIKGTLDSKILKENGIEIKVANLVTNPSLTTLGYTDLNDVTTPGIYVGYGAYANSPLNSSTPFKLVVTATKAIADNSTWIFQQIETLSGDKICQRGKLNANAWYDWKSIVPETITNSNGTAVKFPDGTMICWNYMVVNDQAINNQYGNMYIGTRDINFPAQFISAPSGHCSIFKWGTGASWGNCASVTVSKISVRGYDYQSREAGTNCIISWSAIGRWK